MAKLTFIFTLLLSASAFAEYRVFLLEFTNQNKELVRTVKSTLDPDQYRGYYHVPTDLQVSYTQTWICYGNTAFKPFCQSPQELANEKSETGNSENPDQK